MQVIYLTVFCISWNITGDKFTKLTYRNANFHWLRYSGQVVSLRTSLKNSKHDHTISFHLYIILLTTDVKDLRSHRSLNLSVSLENLQTMVPNKLYSHSNFNSFSLCNPPIHLILYLSLPFLLISFELSFLFSTNICNILTAIPLFFFSLTFSNCEI